MSGTAIIRSFISDFNEGKTFFAYKKLLCRAQTRLIQSAVKHGQGGFKPCFCACFDRCRTDTDKTVSEEENRKLAAKPKFSFTALFDKSYTSDFDTYYADTFPFRDEFLGLNRKISEILTGTKGSGDIVLVSKQDKDDFAGQDID